MTGKADARLLRIARGPRHGAVKREELLAVGISKRMIEQRLAEGALVAIHRGVYLVSAPAPSPLAHEAAAILACRPRALLSHRTAARAWALPVRAGGPIEVTVVGRSRLSLEGVRVHSLTRLPRSELRRHSGLPITSPSLTLLDTAGAGDADELVACVHEARVLRIVTDRQLRATLAAHPNRRGAGALRRLLDTERGPRVTRSEAERRTLRVMRAHGLEPDASDFPVGPYTLDFFFRTERVAVEYDSQQFHDDPKRFVHDRRRVAYLAGRGIQTFPLTSYDLGPGAERAMADLHATLADRRR